MSEKKAGDVRTLTGIRRQAIADLDIYNPVLERPRSIDEALMEAYVLQGERGAYEVLFRRYAPRLQGFFLRSTGDPAVAQDLVQQTFLHVHRARNDFRQGSRFKPWLYTIATNVRGVEASVVDVSANILTGLRH